MALFHENIKQILSEFEKFLNETLKKETKLGKKTLEHKQLILEKLSKFYEENPQMMPTQAVDSLQVKEQDESVMTGGSSKSDESEDSTYIDAGIGLIAAADLKDPLFSGFLEKKQKKGTGLLGPKFQTRWCIIHAGVFYYYEKQKDKKQCGSFKLDGCHFRNAPDITTKKKEKELSFEIYSSEENKRIYQFVAKTKADYDEVHQFVDSGGNALIEEDIYEEVGNEPAPPTPVSTAAPTDLVQEEDYVEDIQVKSEPDNVVDELYEEPEESKPPPPGPKAFRLPLPPPPPDSSPVPKAKTPTMSEPQKTPLIEEELYDEAMSKAAEPPVPERPAPPEVPPPLGKRHRPNRELPSLPPTPVEKKRITVNITCKPEEDFENRYFSKWDCSADKSSELSFKKGDVIYIISKEFDAKAWWVGELNGKFGLVPKTYLVPAFVLVE